MKPQDKKYLEFLDDFYAHLETLPLTSVLDNPEKTAIISVDVTNAFCRTGNLASERVAGIINPIVDLFNGAWNLGLKNIILLQDCHTSDAEEFDEFAEHAVCGSFESEAVDEIKSLPFYREMKIIKKNSINPSHNTLFGNWLHENPHITTFIVAGDCTDLCVYQTAMHLQTSANAFNIERRVIIPEICVNTYDISIKIAKEASLEPHPADMLHKVFLHSMKLNGMEIFKKLV